MTPQQSLMAIAPAGYKYGADYKSAEPVPMHWVLQKLIDKVGLDYGLTSLREQKGVALQFGFIYVVDDTYFNAL